MQAFGLLRDACAAHRLRRAGLGFDMLTSASAIYSLRCYGHFVLPLDECGVPAVYCGYAFCLVCSWGMSACRGGVPAEPGETHRHN